MRIFLKQVGIFFFFFKDFFIKVALLLKTKVIQDIIL